MGPDYVPFQVLLNSLLTIRAFASIECHYFVNGGFFPKDGHLITKEQLDKMWVISPRF